MKRRPHGRHSEVLAPLRTPLRASARSRRRLAVKVRFTAMAVLAAVSVSKLEPVAVGFGAKDAVTPLGRPDTARLTLPVNPYWEFT